jgi:hypothetical protein
MAFQTKLLAGAAVRLSILRRRPDFSAQFCGKTSNYVAEKQRTVKG